MRHENIYRILPSKHPWPCNFAPYQNLCLHWMPTQKHIHVSPHPLNCHISKIKKPNGIYMVVYTSLYGKSCWKYLPLIASCHLLCAVDAEARSLLIGRDESQTTAMYIVRRNYELQTKPARTMSSSPHTTPRDPNIDFLLTHSTMLFFILGGGGCVNLDIDST